MIAGIHLEGNGDNVGEVLGGSMITEVNDHPSSLTSQVKYVDNVMRMMQYDEQETEDTHLRRTQDRHVVLSLSLQPE